MAIDENSKEDMYLRLDLARSGFIKGESGDEAHPDEIKVLHWSWGMESKAPVGADAKNARSSVREITISKIVDRASPRIMSALRQNDKVTKAVLSVRDVRKGPAEYLRVTIEDGRITSYDIHSDGAVVLETIMLSFAKIQVEYKQKLDDGLGPAVVYKDTLYDRNG